MLIQLLPSSTVAAGVRLNTGLGSVASEIPGGTWNPKPPILRRNARTVAVLADNARSARREVSVSAVPTIQRW